MTLFPYIALDFSTATPTLWAGGRVSATSRTAVVNSVVRKQQICTAQLMRLTLTSTVECGQSVCWKQLTRPKSCVHTKLTVRFRLTVPFPSADSFVAF